MDYPRYKFYLDSIEITQPIGWDKMEEGISRDDSLKGILITENVPLDFIGTGYRILKDKFDNEGFTSQTSFLAKESCNQDGVYEDAVKGIIFTSDIEFHLKECIARSKIQDNSYYAKIHNNKSLGARPYVGKSKNDIAISAATITKSQFFKPSDGSYYSILNTAGKERSCAGYRAYDLLKFMIAFMTDGEVGFASTTFDTGGIYEGAWITCGIVIRKVQAGLSITDFEHTFPKLNFQTIMQELDRKYNIGFIIEYVSGQPVIRIEDINFFYNKNTILTLHNIDDIVMSSDVNKLYSKVVFGSTNFLSKQGLSFPEDITFVGFKKEEFIITGKSNIDKALDLSCDWISSSNVIEDTLLNSNATYDDKIFIINVTPGSPYQCVQSNWLQATPPFYYNQTLTNYQVALRYLGAVPNSIADYINSVAPNLFMATIVSNIQAVSITSPPPNPNPILYDDDFNAPNNDVNNKYNPATGEYEAQLGGIYYFEAYNKLLFLIDCSDNPVVNFTVTEYLKVYDAAGFAGGNLVNQVQINQHTYSLSYCAAHYDTTLVSGIVIMPAGGKAIHAFEVTGYDGISISEVFIVQADSYFKCTQTIISIGNAFQTYDPNEYPVTQFTFEKGLTKRQWEILKGAPNKLIDFDDGTNFFRAWVGSAVKHTRLTGNTAFKLTANKKLF